MLHLSGKMKRGGYSLVETILVLGIAGLVLGAIWVASGGIGDKQKANDAFDQMQTVANNIITLKQAQRTTFPAGDTDITPDMITAGAIPRSYLNPLVNTQVNSPWMQSGFFVTGKNNTFRIIFVSPPFGVCVALLLRGVSCKAGDNGCPTAVSTHTNVDLLSPGSGANWLSYTAALGWRNMTLAQANDACSANTPPPSAVTFNYAF